MSVTWQKYLTLKRYQRKSHGLHSGVKVLLWLSTLYLSAHVLAAKLLGRF